MKKTHQSVPYLHVVTEAERGPIDAVEWANAILNGDYDVLLFGRQLGPDRLQSLTVVQPTAPDADSVDPSPQECLTHPAPATDPQP